MLKIILLLVCSVAATIHSEDPGNEDLIQKVPGYPEESQIKVYSNYLFADAQGKRKLHYILIESPENPQNKPLTLWLNGGPGCSSKLGFLQEIGPFILQINGKYDSKDPLIENKYGWTGLSNMLFIDSPAGVGFSINQDPNYLYNDPNTADDNLKAILYFFQKKFPTYRSKDFFIAGESYAGKYIPDLALRIHSYNQDATTRIQLKGILIGNGIIDLSNGNLNKNQIEFFFTHNFIDPTLEPYWYNSCLNDPDSAGCAYFHKRSDELLYKTNPYNIYYPCYDPNAATQQNFIKELAKSSRFTKRNTFKKEDQKELLEDCEYSEGFQRYFFLNKDTFRAPSITHFSMCNETIFQKYAYTESGSMFELPRVVSEVNIRVYLFNGDVDSVVPFTDTLQNLQKLTFKQSGPSRSWIISNQNVGIKKTFTYGDKILKFWTVKGAGHQVPQYKRQVAYQLFSSFLTNQQ